MLPEQKLDALLARHKAVESELATVLSRETYIKLSREFAELGPVVETVKRYRGIASEIDDLNMLIRGDKKVLYLAGVKTAGHVAGSVLDMTMMPVRVIGTSQKKPANDTRPPPTTQAMKHTKRNS